MALYDLAPIKHFLGLDLSYSEDNRAVFDLPYRAELTNAMGSVHGGIVSTLLDNAGWFTAAQHYESWIATAELHVQLLGPAAEQPLRSRGELVRAGRRLAVARMEVHSADGTLVAIGSGTFSVTSRPLTQ